MIPRVLLIDNEDSFTWNLAQLLRESGLCNYRVIPYADTSLEMVQDFDKILISPGPGIPSERPLLKAIISLYAQTRSILGVCLGHQVIAEAYGGKLLNLERVVHGIRQEIKIRDPEEIFFRGISSTVRVGLYHSWAVDKGSLPSCLKITAENDQGIIMAMSHTTLDVKGVQFHPESFMTEQGLAMMKNWLAG